MITTMQKNNIKDLIDRLDERDFNIVYHMISHMLDLDDVESKEDHDAYLASLNESSFTTHADLLKEING